MVCSLVKRPIRSTHGAALFRSEALDCVFGLNCIPCERVKDLNIIKLSICNTIRARVAHEARYTKKNIKNRYRNNMG